MKGNIIGNNKKANKNQWKNFRDELDIDRVVGNSKEKISNPSELGIDMNSNRSSYNLSGLN